VPAERQATLRFLGGRAFEAETGSGHTLRVDAAPDHGGQDSGPSPMELLLAGLGGCTGIDVASMLEKMRQDVTDYRVEVRGTRRDEHPQVFTAIQVTHVVRGRGLDPTKVARAVELSATRYCPASAMLSAVADVQHTFRIEDEPNPMSS
jgi:putative redox protein